MTYAGSGLSCLQRQHLGVLLRCVVHACFLMLLKHEGRQSSEVACVRDRQLLIDGISSVTEGLKA